MTSVNTPTYQNKYVVLAIVSTPYLFSLLHRTCFREYVVLKFVSTSYFSGDFSRSLYKLQLKFEETTRVVCTDFAEVLSLGNVRFIFSSFTSVFQYLKNGVVLCALRFLEK